MSMCDHAVSPGSGAIMIEMHESSCETLSEYAVFARARKRERERGHRIPGELPEAFEAHCRLVEGEPERRRRAALHQPGSPSQGGGGVSRLPNEVVGETAHAAKPDPASR